MSGKKGRSGGHRESRDVQYKGQTISLAEAIRLAGSVVDTTNARKRLYNNWTVEDAVETPIRVAMAPDHARENRLERDRIRQKRHNDKKRKARLAAATAAAPQRFGIKKTSAAYRSMLPPAPEMTKNQLRAVLAPAVRNTRSSVTS